jgi:hypothetical protein
MADKAELAWRAGVVPRELRRQAEVLARLSDNIAQTGDFPTDTPPKLCALIGGTATTLADSLTSAPATHLRLVNEFLRELTTHLRYADRSRLAQTPWSMVHASEAFLKQQVGQHAHFIIRPTWSYNYGLISEFVAVYRYRLTALGWIDIPAWEKRIGCLASEKIYCISFPRLERLNALLHTCWGHEVGHILAQDWTQREFNAFWLKIEGTVTSACKLELQKQKAPTQDQLFWDLLINQSLAEWTKTALEITRFGINELLSDAVGLHLFGPAAFAASAETCANWDLDASPMNAAGYPPWRLRLRLLSEALDDDLKQFKPLGAIEPDAAISPLIKWLQDTTAIMRLGDDVRIIQSDPRTREPYAAIQKDWPGIRLSALKGLPPTSKNPYKLSERLPQISELVSRLEAGIPPNEIGTWPDRKPAVLADILNAGWAFKLKRISDDAAWGTTDDFEGMFRLLLKAVESAHVHATFGQQLAKVGP